MMCPRRCSVVSVRGRAPHLVRKRFPAQDIVQSGFNEHPSYNRQCNDIIMEITSVTCEHYVIGSAIVFYFRRIPRPGQRATVTHHSVAVDETLLMECGQQQTVSVVFVWYATNWTQPQPSAMRSTTRPFFIPTTSTVRTTSTIPSTTTNSKLACILANMMKCGHSTAGNCSHRPDVH